MGFLPIRRGRFLSRTPSAVAAGFALAAVAALVLLTIAAVVAIPRLRATQIDPATTLRAD